MKLAITLFCGLISIDVLLAQTNPIDSLVKNAIAQNLNQIRQIMLPSVAIQALLMEDSSRALDSLPPSISVWNSHPAKY